MNCLCICLAPAIDATVRLDAWPTPGGLVKDAAERRLPGGKAVNVARWLAKRGARVVGDGLLGEDNAAVFEREFAKYGIEDRFGRIPGATRVNEMFVTPQGAFKVNRPAFWRYAGLERFERMEGFDLVVLSGSLPQGWPVETYRQLVVAAKRAGAKVALDASGPALVEGVKAHPDVIKPNAEECEALVGFVPRTPDDFQRATVALRVCCGYPIVSDGASGAWFDGEFVAAPSVEVLDTTAAGGLVLAEWCWRRYGMRSGLSECGRWAVAAGSAACTKAGGEMPEMALVATLAERRES